MQATEQDLNRFMGKVAQQSHCWEWTAAVTSGGYGAFSLGGVQVAAHRFSYELYAGALPAGHQIHHKCNTRRCVNPEHLEAVTPQQNSAYRSNSAFCKHGHAMTPENTYVWRGWRSCRICRNENAKKTAARRKAGSVRQSGHSS